MKTYPNTSIYRDSLSTIDQVDKILAGKKPTSILSKIEEVLIDLSSQLALALEEENIETMDGKLAKLHAYIVQAIQLTNLAYHKHQITLQENETIEEMVAELGHKIKVFPKKRKNILILSSVLGQGHMSASKAIRQGIQFLYGRDYNVVIIDFYDQIGSLFNKATVKAYEGSTKYLPAAYKYFFESTDAKWPVQLLNLVNYPLNAAKLEKLFKSYDPHIIISAFPVWDYLASMIIKKCGNIKFLSVVTDSISIHNAWVTGNPDAHIVANNDTLITLKKLGVEEEKIHPLGFPVRLEFSTPSSRHKFLSEINLNPQLYTIVLQPSAETAKPTIKIINEIQTNFPDVNLIVICGRNVELYPKLEQYNDQKNVRIIGWTDQMPEFIKNCDLVITKAGGATVMECLAAKKPIIITHIIPGQEWGNAELVKIHDLGIVQKSAKMSISECIDYIRKNQDRILKNVASMSNPDASLKIAKFIHEQI